MPAKGKGFALIPLLIIVAVGTALAFTFRDKIPFLASLNSDLPALPEGLEWTEVGVDSQLLSSQALSYGPTEEEYIKLPGTEWIATVLESEASNNPADDFSPTDSYYAILERRGWKPVGSFFTINGKEFTVPSADGYGFSTGGLFKEMGNSVRVVRLSEAFRGDYTIEYSGPQLIYPVNTEYRIFISDWVKKDWVLE